MHVCEKQTDSVTRFHRWGNLSNHVMVWYKRVDMHRSCTVWHVMFVCLHGVSCSYTCDYRLAKNISVQRPNNVLRAI